MCAQPHSAQSPGNLFMSHGVKGGPISTRGHGHGFYIRLRPRVQVTWVARARSRYGGRLAPATHCSERRVHFGGGDELPGVAMH